MSLSLSLSVSEHDWEEAVFGAVVDIVRVLAPVENLRQQDDLHDGLEDSEDRVEGHSNPHINIVELIIDDFDQKLDPLRRKRSQDGQSDNCAEDSSHELTIKVAHQ